MAPAPLEVIYHFCGEKKISGDHIRICREEVSTALLLSLVCLHSCMVDGVITITINKNDYTHGQ